MTKAADRLMMAAQAYADAKRAVDEFDGERRGKPFETACASWRQSVVNLLRAASASAAEQARIAKTEAPQDQEEPA